ncbi:MAG: hypothetical protein Q9227_000380 [Pyrenula ochraceoflavens]
MTTTSSAVSFLGLEGIHVFVTGAAGGIGTEVVKEFIRHGCLVTAHDLNSIDKEALLLPTGSPESLFVVQGDTTSESSISSAIQAATSHFGNQPPQVLVANAGITGETQHPPIWDLPLSTFTRVTQTNSVGTFLSIKHFLANVKAYQETEGKELENLAIIVTGSECGKFGQEGHAEYALGKAGLQYGLVRTVKNEIVRINRLGRVNAVAPGWVDTGLIKGRLDDPREKWAEAEATVPLRKIAQPSDVARAVAFLASHRAAGHISGECISIDGGMEGRLIWREPSSSSTKTPIPLSQTSSIPSSISHPKPKRRLRICITIDFDAISGYLGTGHTPQNTISDYSAGLFSARVGVSRLLRLLHKHSIADKVTWFIPGHSLESFPEATHRIIQSGAEIGVHGYSHEGASAMTPVQEEDVLKKCIELITTTSSHRPRGYRAPLYQLRESTLDLLRKHGFAYDSSLNATESIPYFLPADLPPPPQVPDYSQPAESWMHPLPPSSYHNPSSSSSSSPSHSNIEDDDDDLVEIPGSWYTEDMTPLGFYPYTPNSHDYVPVEAVEKMWMDRLEWLWENECEVDSESSGKEINRGFGSVFTLIWHPESAGRGHVVGMVERVLGRLVGMCGGREEGVSFERMESVARDWRAHCRRRRGMKEEEEEEKGAGDGGKGEV